MFIFQILLNKQSWYKEKNTQQYNVHLIIEMKVTLTDDEGHRQRSKVTKWTYGHMSQTITLTDIIPGTKIQFNTSKWHANLTLTLGQGHNSRSKVTDVEVSAFSECFLLNTLIVSYHSFSSFRQLHMIIPFKYILICTVRVSYL